jgi:DNA-directed RNA polymerase specialized sigma subunit
VWKSYRYIIKRYPRISLAEERSLIKKAQRVSKKSKDEFILRHISFLIFRIHKVTFPEFIQRFGEDLLEEAILVLYKKIKSYDLNYCDNKGNPNPVKFTSYIWKRIDGFILDTLKKELSESNYYDRYSGYAFRNGDLSPMSGQREAD